MLRISLRFQGRSSDRQPPTGDRGRSGRKRARDASGRAGIVSGHGVTTGAGPPAPGGRQSPGRLWHCRPPLREGATGRGRQPPVCRPEQVRSWSPPPRTRELAARERPTSSTTRARRSGQPVTGRRSRTDARRWAEGEGDTTPHPPVNDGCLPEPVKSASRPSDRLRRLLTEPVRRSCSLRAVAIGHEWPRGELNRDERSAEMRRTRESISRSSSVFAAVRDVVRGGVEPPTFRFSGGRSYRLSYLTVARCRACAPTAAVLTGFEPATSTLTGWRALQLLYRTMLPRLLFLARMSISPTLLWLPRRRTPSWREEPRAPNGTRRRRRPPAPPKQYHRQTRGLSPTSGCPADPGSQVPPTGFEPVPPP